jgi:hypothetical protein
LKFTKVLKKEPRDDDSSFSSLAAAAAAVASTLPFLNKGLVHPHKAPTSTMLRNSPALCETKFNHGIVTTETARHEPTHKRDVKLMMMRSKASVCPSSDSARMRAPSTYHHAGRILNVNRQFSRDRTTMFPIQVLRCGFTLQRTTTALLHSTLEYFMQGASIESIDCFPIFWQLRKIKDDSLKTCDDMGADCCHIYSIDNTMGNGTNSYRSRWWHLYTSPFD